MFKIQPGTIKDFNSDGFWPSCRIFV